VIAFASGGLTDVVRDGHTGLLVHAGDAAALAAAIDRLASDPALACALGDAARVESVGRFSPGAVADTYLGIYRDAIGRTAA
jgi:glycosyltransferase involved in cell wall biosynthesis